jgi:hypothetical protein
MSNEYIYFLDYSLIKNNYLTDGACDSDEPNYFPIINTKSYDFVDYANSDFLIYLKSVKATKSSISGFFGYFRSGNILISLVQSKNLKNKPNIVIDDILYRSTLKKYNLCQMDNVLCVECKSMRQFPRVVSLLLYKEICTKNYLEIVKFSTRANCLNVEKILCTEIISVINNEWDKSDAESSSESDTETESSTELETEISPEIKYINPITMKIPIVWIPCNKVIEKINKLNIKKKEILFHYHECEVCDITDNNRKKQEFNKKINLLIKTESQDKEYLDNIINFYQNNIPYKESEEIFNNYKLKQDQINLIYYECEDEFYDKTFFIIDS